METQKCRGIWAGILKAILEALIAGTMGISPREAAYILGSPDTGERRGAGEAHHGR